MSASDIGKTRVPDATPPSRDDPPPETCDHCGSSDLQWINCKSICRNCRQINRSCSDL